MNQVKSLLNNIVLELKVVGGYKNNAINISNTVENFNINKPLLVWDLKM